MTPAVRQARSSFPSPSLAVEDDAEADDWDENVLVSDDHETEDGDEDRASAPAPRGSVRSVTWRRGRVPYLLNDVIEARVAVTRAERDLAKKVKSARSHGATWEEVALAVGMTRQGAAKRFG